MASVEKEALSDFSEIFQESYDKIPQEEESLRAFFRKVNKWYYKPMPENLVNKDKPDLVFQYTEAGQVEFMDFQTELSGITKAVYLVVKDVSEITGSETESYQKSDFIPKEGDPAQGQRQVINVQTGQPSIWHKLLRKKPETNLPKSLEDAWSKSENWKDEVRNIPNIWRKMLIYHHYGKRWQDNFDGSGMLDYRDNEITFLNAYIEPLISNIVTRALDIREGKQTEKIERVYTQTLQMEKELEQAKIMTGQGGEQQNPQQSS